MTIYQNAVTLRKRPNPTNIPQGQAAAEAYSQAHSQPTLDPSNAVAEAEALLEGAQADESPDPLPVVPPAPVIDKTRLRDNVLNIDSEFVGESVLDGVTGLEELETQIRTQLVEPESVRGKKGTDLIK